MAALHSLSADTPRSVAAALRALDGVTGSHPQWAARCPAHDDSSPSLSVTVGEDGLPAFFCHGGCEPWAIRPALLARGVPDEDLRPAHRPKGAPANGHRPAQPRQSVPADDDKPPAPPRPTARLPAPQEVEDWHYALTGAREAWLREERGLTDATIGHAEIGWDGQRYTFPIRDAAGRLVNVRRYRPGADNKWVNCAGAGQDRLYAPHGGDLPAALLLCAGELDMWLAWQHGYNACTFTGGEGKIPDATELERLRDRTVVVAYDADAAGSKGAAKVAAALSRIARSVRLADLASLPLAESGDVTDVLVNPELGPAALMRVVTAAQPYSGTTAEAVGDGREGEGASWLSMDLSGVLSDDWEPRQPTVCGRVDGLALFYRGLTNAIVSESEAGKTWMALHAVAEQIQVDQHVVFLDFEDNEQGVTERLRYLGCDVQTIRKWFHYARPDEPLSPQAQSAVTAHYTPLRPSLVVVDGVTEAMTLHGWDLNSNRDVALFYKLLLPFVAIGAAVVVLDHLPKDDTKGRGSIGGVHKLNGIKGAMYRLQNVKPIIPGKEGFSRVVIDKDRPGQVRRHQDEKKRIAELWVNSRDSGDDVQITLELPRSYNQTPEEQEKHNKSMTKSGKYVQEALGVGVEKTVRMVEKTLAEAGTPLGETTIKRWLKTLHDMGYATLREASHGKRPTDFYTGKEHPT